MDRPITWNFLLLCLLSILFSSCSPSVASSGATPVATNSQPSINPVRTVTQTSKYNPTRSLETIAASEEAPTVTSSKTPTLVDILLSTPGPTLAPEAAQENLESLIQGNANCTLPCFLGITPGFSTINDFETVFSPYSAILTIIEGKDGIGIDFELGQEIKNDFLIGYQTLPDKQTIDRIDIFTQAYRRIDYPYPDEYGATYELQKEYGAESYQQLMNGFSLPQILTGYGTPSKVLVFAEQYLYDGRPPLPTQQFGQLSLRLFYPERGIIIMYEMPLIKAGIYGRGCPSQAFISLWLTPPDIEGDYAKRLSQSEGQGVSFVLEKPLDEATSMSLERFYETYKTPGEKCLQTPLSLWPPG